jgi:hypothetical protein
MYPQPVFSHAQVLTTLANSFPSLTPDFLTKVVKDALTKCASAGTGNAKVTSPQPAAAFTPGSTGTPAPLETAKKVNSEPSLLEEKLDALFGNAEAFILPREPDGTYLDSKGFDIQATEAMFYPNKYEDWNPDVQSRVSCSSTVKYDNVAQQINTLCFAQTAAATAQLYRLCEKYNLKLMLLDSGACDTQIPDSDREYLRDIQPLSRPVMLETADNPNGPICTEFGTLNLTL